MNPDYKWDIVDARPVAQELVNLLTPVCERIEIAGSMRRGKTRISDIELLYVPKFEPRLVDMFESAPFNLADEKLEHLLTTGILEKRKRSDGFFAWGEKNKFATHARSHIPVDLFSTTAENWWVSLVVRTGSKETNLKLTTAAQARGRSLIAYGAGVKQRDRTITPAHSEREVFELCGVPYLEPHQR